MTKLKRMMTKLNFTIKSLMSLYFEYVNKKDRQFSTGDPAILSST